MVTTAAVKKKLAPFPKIALPTLLSKMPRLEVETASDVPRPTKCVKQLAKKGEQEIHVIFSQTMGATILDDSPLVPDVQASMEMHPKVRPHPHIVVETNVASMVEEPTAPGPAITPALEEVLPLA